MKENKKNIQYNASCGCLFDDLVTDSSCNDADSPEIIVEPDSEFLNLKFYSNHLTDGLPIIPPTQDRVQKFLKNSNRDPDDIIAVLPPRMGRATANKVAVNAVMAGCLPSFMPVVESAIESLSQENFNLLGLNTTTHPVAIGLIINGPIREELAFNSGVGCLGPGNISNATIGRAIRLCMINIAGALPGVGDHATMGSPAKFSYCFAEAEGESPWEPLHVERGFNSSESVLTVLGVEAPHNVNDHRSRKAEDLLETIAHTATSAGCNNSHVPGEILIIMSPEHAETISNEGWDKIDVKNFLHENMIISQYLGDRGGRKMEAKWLKDDQSHLTRTPSDVIIVVAGGPGRHTMISHGFGTSCESVTQAIKFNSE